VTAGAARSGLDPTFRGGSGRAAGFGGGSDQGWGAGLSGRTGGAGGGWTDAWTGGDGSGRAGRRAEAGAGAWGSGAGGLASEGSGLVGEGGRSAGGGSGLAGTGRGSGLLQAEKGSSGFEIGGNSDSGGPDGARPDGAVRPDGDVARDSAEPAGTGEEGTAGWPRGAKGRRAGTRKPHASQNWPAKVAPQRGQGSPSSATSRPGAWCLPVMLPRACELPILVPQTSQKSLFTESWPCGHTVLIPTPLNRRFL